MATMTRLLWRCGIALGSSSEISTLCHSRLRNGISAKANLKYLLGQWLILAPLRLSMI